MRFLGISAVLALLLCAVALGATESDSYVPEMHRDGLSYVFNVFNALVDQRTTSYRARIMQNVVANNQTATAILIGELAADIETAFARFAEPELVQTDRVWDSVGIPPALVYAMNILVPGSDFATTGVISGNGLQTVSLALAKYLVMNMYLGQYQTFGPLVFFRTGDNAFRVWCHVHTVVERLAIVNVSGVVGMQPLIIDYYGEKVCHISIYTRTEFAFLLILVDPCVRCSTPPKATSLCAYFRFTA